MKITLKVEKEYNAITLEVKAHVDDWGDFEVFNGDSIPCKDDEDWCPVIDIDSGVIRNWANGIPCSVYCKVRDEGVYRLLDDKGDLIIEKEGYVPDCMSPKESGFGDYIIMDIDEKGKINNWSPDLEDFAPEED